MSLKLKALGLSVLALLAMSAFTAMNAGAKNNGHAEIEGPPTSTTPVTIRGAEGVGHRLHLTKHNETEPIGCDVATYHGSVTTSPVTQIDVTPTYEKCYTTDNPSSTVEVTHNGCKYRFTVEKGGTNGTAELTGCAGPIQIHHPNCTVSVDESQNQNLPGIHYTRITELGKHALTIHVNVTFKATTHSGICIFLGTEANARLKGTVKTWAEHNGERRHITTT